MAMDYGISLALFAWLFAYLCSGLRNDHPQISLLFLINSLMLSLYSFFVMGEITRVDAVYSGVESSLWIVYATQWFVLFTTLIYFFISFFREGLEHLNSSGRPKFGV